MDDIEPVLPGLDGHTGGGHGERIKLADIEALTPRSSKGFAIALENARVEASLPSQIWDRAIVLEDIIVHSMHEPRRALDLQYQYLRQYFLNDTGTTELVPDFVSECEDLPSVWRYLDRMNVSVEEQIQHVGEAFHELASFMELVFRPRHVGYDREPWPGKPVTTPFAKIVPASSLESLESSAWTGRYDPVQQARRVLSLAPLALTAVDRLIEAAEEARRNNTPPEQLEPPELAQLRELHAELGALIKAAKRGADLTPRLTAVKNAFGKAFQLLSSTGELVVADVPPIAAAMVPTWATYGLCSALLNMSEASSATIAAGALAASGTLQAVRLSRNTSSDTGADRS